VPTHISFREIGRHLHVSANTVKTHAHAVYRKLGVCSRSEAVVRAQHRLARRLTAATLAAVRLVAIPGSGRSTAARPVGRGRAVVEMLAGQLYLVTAIGVLVGGFVGRRRG